MNVEPLMAHGVGGPMSLLRFWVGEHFSYIALNGGSKNSSKNILICVQKMNEGLIVLDQYEGV